MKGSTIRPLLALLMVSSAASAVKVPIPVEGASLNISAQFQPQVLFAESGAPNADNLGVDFSVRRARLLVNGDINSYFTYLLQLDMPGIGRRGIYPTVCPAGGCAATNGNFAYVQDAWVGWAPTGISGGTVIYIDAGILLQPISRHLLESTTNFVTADVHGDSFRIIGGMPGLRDPGVQIRGWALNKKIGFRGGVYEGVRTAAYQTGPTPVPATTVNPSGNPRLAGFVNVDLLGSEEGGWLYQGNYWAKDPVVSVGGSANYQKDALIGPSGRTDNFVGSAHLFVDFPVSEALETTFQVVGYRSTQGKGSRNTGWGGFADLGVRFGDVKPYVSFEGFWGDDCDIAGSTCAVGGLAAKTADTRVFRAGINYFIDRNRNHVNVEYANNRGVSAIAPPSEPTTNVGASGKNTVLVHWNVLF